ncbi:hypothetical protein IX339_000032 [Porphyromonas levii]|nr:hypothetical protein [Porphyromonas levii]
MLVNLLALKRMADYFSREQKWKTSFLEENTGKYDVLMSSQKYILLHHNTFFYIVYGKSFYVG